MPTFLCPHCRHPITTSQDLTGKILRCPSCQKAFTFAPRQQTVTLPPRQSVQAPADGEPTLPPASRGEAQTLAPAVADEQATLAPAAPAAAGGNGKVAIAGYQVERELGRGGMGVVYQALDLRLKRRVALKMVLAGGHAGPAELARFRTEAEAVARLQHPNIVQIHEVGVHNGLPFFCLEFCPGGALDRKLDGTPLPPGEAAALVEKLAHAMQAAHAKGVIHRDLKPANVLLAEDGTPKITDFGLARKLDEEGQTQTGSIMGTPSYMAPEQAGGSKDIGPAADVYALGAILYELLTGRPPFKAATPLDTIMQVVSDEPVPPTQLQSKTPRDLETIALKCLQKEAGNRYSSARELAEDLRRFQEGKPIAARPVSRLERSWRWCCRNPVVAGLLLAVAAALLLGTAGATFFAIRADRARQIADAARDVAVGEKKAADEARQETEREKKAADEARQTAERERDHNAWLVYTGRITLAQREWQDNNAGQARRLLDACPPQLRGWEYHYLHTLFEKNQLTFRGHATGVTCVSWHPDGKRLLSGSWDGVVKVWDVDEQKELFSGLHAGAGQRVTSVSWSPDGKSFASAGWDGTVKVWDAASNQQVQTLKYGGQLRSLSWSPNSKRLAAAGDNTRVATWVVATGRKTELPALALCVSWSPDGKHLAIGFFDRVLLCDPVSGEEAASLKGTGPFMALCWSPDGKLLAGTGDGMVQLWDVAAGKALGTLEGPGKFRCAAWAPDGRHLATAGTDRTVKVWDTQTGQQTGDFKGHTEAVSWVAWGGDGKQLASSSDDGTVKVWALGPGPDAATFKGGEMVTSVSWSGDGERLAAAGFSTMKVWDVASKKEVSLADQLNPEARAYLSPDGKRLARGPCLDGAIHVWDVEEKKVIHRIKGHAGRIRSVSWSPDGKYLASGGEDNTVKVWEARTGQEVISLQGHTDSVLCVSWSPDGKRLASGSFDNTVRVWDVATGKETIDPLKHLGYVMSVCWRPDGQRLASACASRCVKMWTATGQEALTCEGHGEWVASLSWSPDGKRLAGACTENKVMVWDSATGQQTLSLKGQAAWTCVSWSPDGRRLAGGSMLGEVKVWEGQP